MNTIDVSQIVIKQFEPYFYRVADHQVSSCNVSIGQLWTSRRMVLASKSEYAEGFTWAAKNRQTINVISAIAYYSNTSLKNTLEALTDLGFDTDEYLNKTFMFMASGNVVVKSKYRLKLRVITDSFFSTNSYHHPVEGKLLKVTVKRLEETGRRRNGWIEALLKD